MENSSLLPLEGLGIPFFQHFGAGYDTPIRRSANERLDRPRLSIELSRIGSVLQRIGFVVVFPSEDDRPVDPTRLFASRGGPPRH